MQSTEHQNKVAYLHYPHRK